MKGGTRNFKSGEKISARIASVADSEAKGLRAKVIDWLNGDTSAPNLSSAVYISDKSGGCISGKSSTSPCDSVKNDDVFNVQHLIENRSVYPIWIQQTFVFQTNIDFDDCDDGQFREDRTLLCNDECGLEYTRELTVAGSASGKDSYLDLSGVVEAIAKQALHGRVILAQRKFDC